MFKRKITKKIACPSCGHIIEKQGFAGEKSIIICQKCSKKGYYIIPNESISKEQLLRMLIPTSIVFIIISLIHTLFNTNELFTIIGFLLIIPIFIIFKYKIKIIFGFTIGLLVFSMISLTIYNEELLVNQLVNYVYWLLVVGVLCQIIKSLSGLKLSILKKIFG